MVFGGFGKSIHHNSITSAQLGAAAGAAELAMVLPQRGAAGWDPGLRQDMGTGMAPARSQLSWINHAEVERTECPRVSQHGARLLLIPPGLFHPSKTLPRGASSREELQVTCLVLIKT